MFLSFFVLSFLHFIFVLPFIFLFFCIRLPTKRAQQKNTSRRKSPRALPTILAENSTSVSAENVPDGDGLSDQQKDPTAPQAGRRALLDEHLTATDEVTNQRTNGETPLPQADKAGPPATEPNMELPSSRLNETKQEILPKSGGTDRQPDERIIR